MNQKTLENTFLSRTSIPAYLSHLSLLFYNRIVALGIRQKCIVTNNETRQKRCDKRCMYYRRLSTAVTNFFFEFIFLGCGICLSSFLNASHFTNRQYLQIDSNWMDQCPWFSITYPMDYRP